MPVVKVELQRPCLNGLSQLPEFRWGIFWIFSGANL